jgi:hypothetical protein
VLLIVNYVLFSAINQWVMWGEQGNIYDGCVTCNTGVLRRKSVVKVTVLVTSDTVTIFTRNVYNASVREAAMSHSPASLLQTDNFLGHKFVYTLVGGDPFDQFYVTFDTGLYVYY